MTNSVVFFILILYVLVNNISVMSGRIFVGQVLISMLAGSSSDMYQDWKMLYVLSSAVVVFFLFFFKINFFENVFQKCHPSVKEFGSRSGPTFSRA